MLQNLLCYFFGYVNAEATGEFMERFLNLCALKKRDIWNIRRRDNKICFTAKAKEYKNLRNDARRSRVKLKVVKKTGLPFVIYRSRRRYGIPAGIVVGFVIMFILSGCVWNINITGNEQLSDEAVTYALREYGVYEGMKKSDLDPTNTREKIMSKYNGIAWMSLNPDGTTLEVNISEKTAPPNQSGDGQPCNLIAKCDGVITSVQVVSGKAMVSVGDAVVKGDILVSGIMEYSENVRIIKEAKGVVTAKTVRSISSTVALESEEMVPTGRKKTKNVLHFYNANVPLYLGNLPKNWSKTTQSKFLKVNNVKLPIGLTTAVFAENNKEKINISADDATEIARNDIKTRIKSLLKDERYEMLQEIVRNDEKSVSVTQKYSGDEDIAITQKLLIF